jgi:hypothetical protein
MIGASIGGGIGAARLEYLFRHDRGPGGLMWASGELGAAGYETRTSHGLLLEIEREKQWTLRGQYLTGKTGLNTELVFDDWLVMEDGDLSGYDEDWEEGYRALAGLLLEMGPFDGLLEWRRTVIERNTDLLVSEEMWAEATMDVFEAGLGYEVDRLTAALKVDLLDFSGEGGSGRTFWLQGCNFWLDGDMLRTELLQFLESERVWRISLEFEEKGAPVIPGPYRIEGYLKAKVNLDDKESRSVFEISGGKGFGLGSYLSIHADIRYVSYSDDRWQGDSGFFNLWAGLRGNLGGSGWAALGIGVAPHRFDRWFYDFTGDGRESYLLDRGVFQAVFPRQAGGDYLGALEEAEKALSEEWSLIFEGGLAF